MLRNLYRAKRYILGIGLTVVIGGGVYNFIFKDMVNRWREIDIEIIRKRAMLEKGIRFIEERDRILQECNQYAGSFQDMSDVLRAIERCASETEIILTNIKPVDATGREPHKGHIIELQLKGKIDNIFRFFNELIKPPLFATLERCGLRRRIEEKDGFFKGDAALSLSFPKII